MAAGRSIAALNNRAIRSPHRSTGAVPAAIAVSRSCGVSTMGTAIAPTAASASIPSGVTPPPRAMHALPAACARFATPSAVLP